MPTIKELKEGDAVDQVFLVKSKRRLQTRSGSPYLSVRLGDRSGEIEGRVWDRVDALSGQFSQDDFIRVQGVVSTYQGAEQVGIRTLERVPDETVDVEDFLPRSRREPDEMLKEFEGLVAEVQDPHLRRLMELFLEDKVFAERLKRAPAAKAMHHVYIGGLIEHMIDLVRLARDVARHFPEVNGDMVVAGCFFHDIGKVAELSYQRSIDYTLEGHLVGHIALGYEWAGDRIRQIEGFPEDLAMQLKHIILSHHGEYEYGSPKRPKTMEALLVHYLDNLCAKVAHFREAADRELGEGQSGLMGYQRMVGRVLYRP